MRRKRKQSPARRVHRREKEWAQERSGSARRSRRTSERSVFARTATRNAIVKPRLSDDESVRRILGRAHQYGRRWIFDAARRLRGGQRELEWQGAHAPEDGDYCIADVWDEGPALLVEVLGAEDRPEWDDHAVASMFRLRRRFPREAEREARAFGEPVATDFRGRVDLRERLVFTIDPQDARDHDDALSVRNIGRGRWEVGVHIADVSHYVRPGSALDREAVRRGTFPSFRIGSRIMIPTAKLRAELGIDEDRLDADPAPVTPEVSVCRWCPKCGHAHECISP